MAKSIKCFAKINEDIKNTYLQKAVSWLALLTRDFFISKSHELSEIYILAPVPCSK